MLADLTCWMLTKVRRRHSLGPATGRQFSLSAAKGGGTVQETAMGDDMEQHWFFTLQEVETPCGRMNAYNFRNTDARDLRDEITTRLVATY